MEEERGSKDAIQVYLRIRPVKAASVVGSKDIQTATIAVARSKLDGTERLEEEYQFKFDAILGADCTQEQVFEEVGLPAVNSALEGFNGTVFAYGQTGSGKTFTMTGGPEKYADRGLIPRSVGHIFSCMKSRESTQYSVKISYMEIYNELGYDLLDSRQDISSLEDLEKVRAMELEDGKVFLRNLALHTVDSDEQALNLLFLGDTNRAISSTPMNQASTRSHCIFTLHIQSRKAGEEVIRESKLHFVDLAGSERVKKSNLDGQILKEAKHINLSLHYLEQVIGALQERAQGGNRLHIPYRNSMLTTVLKDSLGGNTRTAMIATVNGAEKQMEESLSTCRFAQRVAKIRNLVAVNEVLDPWMVIHRLKSEITTLKEQCGSETEDIQNSEPLNNEEFEATRTKIEEYAHAANMEASLDIPYIARFLAPAFSIFKTLLQAAYSDRDQEQKVKQTTVSQNTISTLKTQIAQRDREIQALTSMLQKQNNSLGQPSKAPLALQNKDDQVAKGIDSQKGVAPVLQHSQSSITYTQRQKLAAEIVAKQQLLSHKCRQAQALVQPLIRSKEHIASLKERVSKIQIVAAVNRAGPDEEDTKHLQALLSELAKVKNFQSDGLDKLRMLKTQIEVLKGEVQSARDHLLPKVPNIEVHSSEAPLQPSLAPSSAKQEAPSYEVQKPGHLHQEFSKVDTIDSKDRLEPTQATSGNMPAQVLEPISSNSEDAYPAEKEQDNHASVPAQSARERTEDLGANQLGSLDYQGQIPERHQVSREDLNPQDGEHGDGQAMRMTHPDKRASLDNIMEMISGTDDANTRPSLLVGVGRVDDHIKRFYRACSLAKSPQTP